MPARPEVDRRCQELRQRAHGAVSLTGFTRRVCGVSWQVVAQGAVGLSIRVARDLRTLDGARLALDLDANARAFFTSHVV